MAGLVPRRLLVLALALAASSYGAAGQDRETARADRPRHLLIVLDGLRPDYVQPHFMPALHALGRRGMVMTRHHAVFPTVTRVNAASISTGAYPETHGLLGNAVFFPRVDAARFLSTSDRGNLLRIDAAVDEGLLTAATLGEALQSAGERLLVVSAGSSGSSHLLNHRVAGGAILHYEYSRPADLRRQAVDRLGAVPPAGTPNHARNRWVVDAFLEVALPAIDPTVTVLWLSDPDTTAHRHGVGHPLVVEALFRLDAEIQRLQDGLAAAGLADTTNVWVTSDHGFSEHTGGVDVEAVLAPFATPLDDGAPRVVAGDGAVYVRDGDAAVVSAVAAALQATRGVGAVFTRGAGPGAREGAVAGTLSLALARWDHPRAAQILYSPDWTAAAGRYGFRGTSAQPGSAGHGSSSPFDVRIPLVAVGPDLKAGVESGVPSGNVDFAPTFLHTLGIEIPASMQGRVLHEALRGGPDPSEVAVESSEVRVESAGGSYRLTAAVSRVGGRSYLDYTTVERPE